MTHPADKLWRSLVYFKSVNKKQKTALVLVPGWGSSEEDSVVINLGDLPEEVRSAAVPGYRCHAWVNIGAEDKSSLLFKYWALDGPVCLKCKTMIFDGTHGYHCLCKITAAFRSLDEWEQYLSDR